MGLSIIVWESNILQCGDAILYTYDSIVERKMTISLQIWGALVNKYFLVCLYYDCKVVTVMIPVV